MAKRIKRSQPDILHREALTAIRKLYDQARAGVLTPEQFRQTVVEIQQATAPLDDVRKGRLQIRINEARRALIQPTGRGGTQRAVRRLGGPAERIRPGLAQTAGGPLVLRAQGAGVANPAVRQAMQAGQQQAIAAEQQRAAAAGLQERLAGQRTRIGERLGRISIPGVIGQKPAESIPGVRVQLERMARATTPEGVSAAGKSAVRQAVQGRARGGAIRKYGRGGAAGLLTALLASRIFSGKDTEGISPEVQMALAQQLGGGQAAGGMPATSRTLIDIARLVTILKGLQGLAGAQGPVAQPRLI